MRVYIRGGIYHMDATVLGKRYRESLGTSDQAEANIEAARRVENYRRVVPSIIVWEHLIHRWFTDRADKRSISRDRDFEAYFSKAFAGREIASITNVEVRDLLAKKRDETSPSNANRYLAFIRALFNHARGLDWEVQSMKLPAFKVPKANRVRYLEREQLSALLSELPPHLAAMFEFSTLTGLRQANVCYLRWEWVMGSLVIIPGSEAKSGVDMPIPLSTRAREIVEAQRGRHSEFVFAYQPPKGPARPIKQPNNWAWRKALKRAGIKDFRWHDGRHTFAAYHVMSGTPDSALQQLGGWESASMVKKYSRLRMGALQGFADRQGQIAKGEK